MQHGDAYTVLRNGDEAYPPMLAAIDAAKTRVGFETYAFKDDEIGTRFIDAMARAARARRVRPHRARSDGLDHRPGERGSAEGRGRAPRLVQPARVLLSLEDFNYRTHRKTMVVDGDVAFIGGMGVSDQWLGHAQDKEHWRDTHFKVTGPAVRALEGSFYENWIETGGLSAPALDPPLPSRATGARSVVVWSNPMTGASNVKLQYLLALGAARQTIDIQSPYITLDLVDPVEPRRARASAVSRIRLLAEGRDHRRHAGQACQPLRLPAAARPGHRDRPSTSRR